MTRRKGAQRKMAGSNKGGGIWLFCIIFIIIGGIFTWLGWLAGQEADRLAGIPVLDLAALRAASPGAIAVIEGRIAERNPLQHQTLVAFIQEQYQGEDCDDDGCDAIWREQQRATPPLWLDLPGGRAQIINDGYYMQNPTAGWESTPNRIAYKTIRYQGFEINDQVFAEGRVAPATDEAPAFEATFLSGGTQAWRIADQRFIGRLFFWLGLLFVTFSLGAAIYLGRR